MLPIAQLRGDMITGVAMTHPGIGRATLTIRLEAVGVVEALDHRMS